VVTLAGQGVRLVVQLTGIVVLGRLLTPADYGLIAVVAVLIGFGELFRDSGLSSAAIQARSLTTGQRDNLFWLNTGIGAVLTLVVAASAPLVALAFGDDRLVPVTAAMAATFLLNGVSTQYRAMHARNLRFGKLAMAEIGGQVAGVTVGVVLAVLGAGYWALVAQPLVQGLVALVLLLLTSGWLPGRPRRADSIRSFVGYGLPLLGASLLGYLGSNVDTLTIGARFGPTAVGPYNRAFQLVTMPLLQVQAPATRVALPVLSRLQDERKRFADFVCFGQVVLLTLIGGLFAILLAQAPDVVHIALGPQWGETVPLFRLLLVAGFFQAAGYAAYWVFLARGLTRSQLRYGLASRPLMAAMVVAGSVWGVTGVAAAYTLAVALNWPASLLWLRRATDVPAGRMFTNGLRSGAVFGAASAASYLATVEMAPGAHVLRLATGILVVLVVAGLAAALVPPFRRDLIAITGLRQHLRRGGGAAASPPAAGATPAVPSRDPADPEVVPRAEVLP
jgi:PST family polysaccharide transporter